MNLIEFNILEFIPQELRQQAQDTLVDFVSEQAKKLVGDVTAEKLKQLRSDGSFMRQFDKGLDKAIKRFADEYYDQDEVLVEAITQEKKLFKNPEVKQALMTMLKSPGSYLADEGDVVAQTFDSVLPGRKNRERVNKAMMYLLRCLVEELWHLPELQPVYSLQFQKITAEAMKQQVELQKVQLQALVGVNEGVRQALLQLTDAIGEKKLLPAQNSPALPARPKVLHNLPQPDFDEFIGREKELAQITSSLSSTSRHFLITIDGIGGVGKSAIALETAHRYLRDYEQKPAEECFDAIIWVSAKQTVLTTEGIVKRPRILRTLDDLFTTIAVTLKNDEVIRARPEEQAEMIQSALTRQRTLLIVDNLETVDDEAFVTFLRELPAPTKAIVTTRHRIDTAYPIRLKQMPLDDALKLIEQECAKKNATITNKESQQLYKDTDGVPLAIVWSISQVALGHGIKSVLTRLADREGDINKYCFSSAYDLVKNKPSEKVLKALGIMTKDATREALGIIANLDELERDDALVTLERLSLVNKQADRFSLLQLTRNFIIAETKFEEGTNYRLRALEYCTNQFKDARDADGSEDTVYTQILVNFERENILGLTDWAISFGHSKAALLTITNFYYAFWRHGLWGILTTYLSTGVQIAHEINDVYSIGILEKNLGRMLRIQGYLEQAEASLQSALSHFENLGDDVQVIETQRNLAMLYVSKNELDKAEAIFLSCMKRIEEDTNFPNKDKNILHILNNYTEILLRKKDYSKTEQYINRAEEIAERNHEVGDLIINYRMRGRLYVSSGKIEQAKEYFLRALELSKKVQIIPDQAYAMKWLARVALQNKDFSSAKEWALKANAIFKELDMVSDTQQIHDILVTVDSNS